MILETKILASKLDVRSFTDNLMDVHVQINNPDELVDSYIDVIGLNNFLKKYDVEVIKSAMALNEVR